MERRKHSRLRVEIDVDYAVRECHSEPLRLRSGQAPAKNPPRGGAWKRPVKTKSADISMGGLRLVTSEVMEKGTELDLIIHLGAKAEIGVKGTVVWQRKFPNKNTRCEIRDTRYETGIKIKPLKEKDEKRFSDFVFKQMYEMIGLPNWPWRT